MFAPVSIGWFLCRLVFFSEELCKNYWMDFHVTWWKVGTSVQKKTNQTLAWSTFHNIATYGYFWHVPQFPRVTPCSILQKCTLIYPWECWCIHQVIFYHQRNSFTGSAIQFCTLWKTICTDLIGLCQVIHCSKYASLICIGFLSCCPGRVFSCQCGWVLCIAMLVVNHFTPTRRNWSMCQEIMAG